MLLDPVRVQGEGSAEEIENAIKMINEREDVDLIILGRGGGSWEDLWAFNEERVARAIFESRIPIISAVGHETDFTIADFVADKRAPTPSAAAEMAVPDRKEILEYMIGLLEKMERILKTKLEFYKGMLNAILKRKAFMYPYEALYDKIERLDEIVENLKRNMLEEIDKRRRKIEEMERNLNALSPFKVLERGYSICFRVRDNKLFSSINDADIGEDLRIVVKDGEAICKLKEKK